MRGIPKRVQLVVFSFLLLVLLYVDRVCISAAKDPIAQSLGFSDTQMGWVLSAFALGYALFQTPAGMMADRFGPRGVLAMVVTFWSIFTALTAMTWNFTSMLIVRFLFGAGEAGAFPGIARAVYSWIPMDERGRVQGISFSGSRLGAAFTLPLVAWMIGLMGWKFSFFILCMIGIVWATIWYYWFRNDPTQHPAISPEEREYILRTRQQETVGQAALSAAVLFSSRNMWLVMVQYFCSNFTFFFCLTWLFPHLKAEYQLEMVEAGLWASAPLIFGAFGNWFAGWMMDAIFRKGRWVLSRKATAMTGFTLAAGGLAASVFMETPFTAVACLSVAIFGADMTLPPSWSTCIDIGRRHSGAVSGTMNMAGNFGSFLTALAFPYLQAWTGSTTPFFFVGAALNGVAILLWSMTRPDRPLEEF